MRRNIASTFALFLLSSTFGCITPGTYRVYRVAQSSAVLGPGCGLTQDDALDSNSFKSGMTFAIYAADSDTYFLDLANESIQGTKDGDYKFEGEMVDVTPTPDAATTVRRDLTIKLDIKGRKISGTWTETNSSTCVGANCGNPYSCTTEVKFEGSEMEDVDLEHQV